MLPIPSSEPISAHLEPAVDPEAERCARYRRLGRAGALGVDVQVRLGRGAGVADFAEERSGHDLLARRDRYAAPAHMGQHDPRRAAVQDDLVAETVERILLQDLEIRPVAFGCHHGAVAGRVQAGADMPQLVNAFGTYILEDGTWAADLAEPLEAMGFEVRIGPRPSGVQAISIEGGWLSGAADRRREGIALGE